MQMIQQYLEPLLKSCPISTSVLLVVGSLSVLSLVRRFSSFLYRNFLRPSKNLYKTYGNQDSWAVITGASDGIGKDFCHSIAKRGFNICLISRNIEKLEAVQKEIQIFNPKIKTCVVIADFSQGPKDPVTFYTRIAEELDQKGVQDIALLINNAGYSDMDRYQNMGYQHIQDMIAVNVYPVAFLTRLLVPKMLARTKKSLVISLASVTSVSPVPFLGVYAGTKAFNNQFSQSMAVEYQDRIDFLSLRPNYVSSKMTKLKPGGVVISPTACAEACLRSAGWDTTTSGHWKHAALEWLMTKVLPGSYLKKQTEVVMKRIEDRKKKA